MATGQCGCTALCQPNQKAITSGLKPPPIGNAPKLSLDDAHRHFTHLGLLWNPSAAPMGPWELGLPSFFDYVESLYATPGMQDYHKTLSDLIADESSFIPEAPAAEDDPSGR